MSHRGRGLLPGTLAIGALFVALVALKLLVFGGAVSPFVFHDELSYITGARALVRDGVYPTTDGHYPPLYPLALTAALLMGGSWYEWVIRTNVLLSSAALFPVYLIARRLLSPRLAVLCAALAAALPYHWIYPRVVFSENLYGPLFLGAVYLVVVRGAGWPRAHALAFGVTLGLCQLTRHLNLVVLPILAGAYVLFQVGRAEHRRRLGVLALVAAGFVAVYAPWVVYMLARGGTVARAIGIGVARDQLGGATVHAPGALAAAFLPWVGVFALTTALLLSPWATALAVGRLPDGERAGLWRRLALVAALTLLAFAGAAMAFEWRYFGGAWEGAYIEERYLLPVLPLLPILAVSRLGGSTRGSVSRRWLVAVGLGYLVMLGLIYGGLLSYRFWAAHPTGSHPVASPHLASVAHTFGDPPGRTLARLTLAATGLLTVAAVARSGALAVGVLALGVVAGSAVGAYRLTAAMTFLQGRASHGRMLAEALGDARTRAAPGPLVAIWLGEGMSVTQGAMSQLVSVMAFWDVRRTITVHEASPSAPPTDGLFVTRARPDAGVTPRARYAVLGREYAVYRVGDPAFPGVFRAAMLYDTPLRIVEFGPREVTAGRRFSVQPGGSSAGWATATGVSGRTTAELNGIALRTTVVDVEGGLVTFIVPPPAYAVAGQYPLVLRDDSTRRVSAPVPFVVR